MGIIFLLNLRGFVEFLKLKNLIYFIVAIFNLDCLSFRVFILTWFGFFFNYKKNFFLVNLDRHFFWDLLIFLIIYGFLSNYLYVSL